MQSTSFGSIWIFPAVPAEELVTASGEEEDFGYL
jgi:hypothetical protein